VPAALLACQPLLNGIVVENCDQRTYIVNNPMIPHVIVLEPGLVIYKIYNGYWSSAGPLRKISARTYAP
jgi:hypothetical protein